MNGDSIWFTSQHNKKGDLEGITMHVTGKVLNDSNERIDMESTVKNITKAMKRAFKGDIGDISFSSDIQLSSVKNMHEVSDSYHLFVLTDKIS